MQTWTKCGGDSGHGSLDDDGGGGGGHDSLDDDGGGSRSVWLTSSS